MLVYAKECFSGERGGLWPLVSYLHLLQKQNANLIQTLDIPVGWIQGKQLRISKKYIDDLSLFCKTTEPISTKRGRKHPWRNFAQMFFSRTSTGTLSYRARNVDFSMNQVAINYERGYPLFNKNSIPSARWNVLNLDEASILYRHPVISFYVYAFFCCCRLM